ncbi:trafficking protein particle complex subunit 12 [Schistocerca cancellata]|uniref:trafficking protein particle complex subunit 12 n=1 Tax=Schistocerca cancellata TaxID=274614 RepID=UPI00211816CF|nr:trafficking protein particle complex subunit 12 [Schistocerca cancellata]XP_049764256.1 trafficking protein particle complex subunit 12 [Schistocerca cancellata]
MNIHRNGKTETSTLSVDHTTNSSGFKQANVTAVSNFLVRYESEKVSQTNSTDKNDKPSLSKYFSQTTQSPATSFFDQLSGASNNPAMMTSVRESSSSQDLFSASQSQVFTGQAQKQFGANQSQSLFGAAQTKLPRENEPTVCRIFASQEMSPAVDTSNPSSAKAFFDMLGSVSGSGNHILSVEMPSDTTSSVLTSPDLTATTDDDISFLSPSSPPGQHPSEADRRRDAWIPTEHTRKALIAAATSPPGTYAPDRELLTMPGVVLEDEMADTVLEMVTHYLGEAEAAKRNVLTASDVTQDDRGLRELIQAGCFRAAVNLTGRLLTMYGQGAGRAGHPSKHTVHSIQLWFTRIALLVKLRSFSLAEVEAEPFGALDRPDMYFQFYPELYGGRIGSLAPFSFRLLLAELPQFLGKPQEALSRLHILLATVRKILRNLKIGLCEDGSPAELSITDRTESQKLWKAREARVLHSITNCAVYQKDYNLAVEVMELLLAEPTCTGHHRRALQSALGRIFLQLGDVAGAERNFSIARELRQQSSGVSETSPDLRELIDRGLMAVAQNAFQEAYECFQKASGLDPDNIMLVNNMAVCLLYLGRLRDALMLMEGGVRANPARGLHESVLLNICTLYELQSSLCNQRKLGMLALLGRYKGDGAYVGSLKLQV